MFKNKIMILEIVTYLLLLLTTIYTIIKFNNSIALSVSLLIASIIYLLSILALKVRKKRYNFKNIKYEVYPYILIIVICLLNIMFLNVTFVIVRDVVFLEVIYLTLYLLSLYVFSPNIDTASRDFENYFRGVIVSKLERILLHDVSDELLMEVLFILNYFKNTNFLNYQALNHEVALLSLLISEGESEEKVLEQVRKTRIIIKEKTR